MLAARKAEQLDEVDDQCAAAGAQTFVRVTDMRVATQCRGLIADAAARYGRLDSLVCNAGISAHAWLEEVDDASSCSSMRWL